MVTIARRKDRRKMAKLAEFGNLVGFVQKLSPGFANQGHPILENKVRKTKNRHGICRNDPIDLGYPKPGFKRLVSSEFYAPPPAKRWWP